MRRNMQLPIWTFAAQGQANTAGRKPPLPAADRNDVIDFPLARQAAEQARVRQGTNQNSSSWARAVTNLSPALPNVGWVYGSLSSSTARGQRVASNGKGQNMNSDCSRLLAKSVLATAVAFMGCGAPLEPGETDIDEWSEVVSQTQQELSAPTRGTTFAYGVTTASSHLACTTTSTGQSCLVPKKKTHKWCVVDGAPLVTGGLTTQEKADVVLVANALNAANTGFTLTHTVDGTQCVSDFGNQLTDILFLSQSCSGTCSSVSTIDGCVCMVATQGAQLTESVPGNFFVSSRGTVHIDSADIQSSGMSATEVRRHGIAKAFLAVEGLGATTGDLILFTERTASDATVHDGFTSGQLCQMRAYNPTSPTTWATVGACFF